MKKGYSYITLSDKDDHVLINALKAKGINKIQLIYASSISPNAGWDMINCDKHLVGCDGWLGYSKKDAIKLIERFRVEDNRFLYLD